MDYKMSAPTRKALYLRKYYSNPANRQRRRIQVRKYVNRRYYEMRGTLISMLGAKCSSPRCLVPGGCTDIRCLQLDHINGGGTQAHKRGWVRMMTHYMKTPEDVRKDLQVLCANCNWIKRRENNEEHKYQ